ncbi:MAG: hypothetical protein KDD60_05975 [Bdellovibrionales bacterium]|nr:hypothetical protein [Bdellovibrionales bacterium]
MWIISQVQHKSSQAPALDISLLFNCPLARASIGISTISKANIELQISPTGGHPFHPLPSEDWNRVNYDASESDEDQANLASLKATRAEILSRNRDVQITLNNVYGQYFGRIDLHNIPIEDAMEIADQLSSIPIQQERLATTRQMGMYVSPQKLETLLTTALSSSGAHISSTLTDGGPTQIIEEYWRQVTRRPLLAVERREQLPTITGLTIDRTTGKARPLGDLTSAPPPPDDETVQWFQVTDPTPKLIERLIRVYGSEYGFTERLLSSLFHPSERSIKHVGEHTLYARLHPFLEVNPGSVDVTFTRLHAVIGKNFIVTFHNGDLPTLHHEMNTLEKTPAIQPGITSLDLFAHVYSGIIDSNNRLVYNLTNKLQKAAAELSEARRESQREEIERIAWSLISIRNKIFSEHAVAEQLAEHYQFPGMNENSVGRTVDMITRSLNRLDARIGQAVRQIEDFENNYRVSQLQREEEREKSAQRHPRRLELLAGALGPTLFALSYNEAFQDSISVAAREQNFYSSLLVSGVLVGIALVDYLRNFLKNRQHPDIPKGF